MKSPEAFALCVSLETALIFRDTLAAQFDQAVTDAREAIALIDAMPATNRRRAVARYQSALEALNDAMRFATRALRGETP